MEKYLYKLVVAVTPLSGVQLLTIGVIGEYIGRAHQNINNRPQFTIRKARLQK